MWKGICHDTLCVSEVVKFSVLLQVVLKLNSKGVVTKWLPLQSFKKNYSICRDRRTHTILYCGYSIHPLNYIHRQKDFNLRIVRGFKDYPFLRGVNPHGQFLVCNFCEKSNASQGIATVREGESSPFFKLFLSKQPTTGEENSTTTRWVPSLWESVTPPLLWKILAMPLLVSQVMLV